MLNHFASKAFCTLRNNNWIQLLFRKIQLLFRKVQNALIAKWLSTARALSRSLSLSLSLSHTHTQYMGHTALHLAASLHLTCGLRPTTPGPPLWPFDDVGVAEALLKAGCKKDIQDMV